MFRFFQLPNHAFNCKQLDTHILLYYGEFTSCLAKAYIESRFIRHGGAETSQENMKEIWKILNPSIQQPQHQLETLRLISRWPKRERTPELLSLSLKSALTGIYTKLLRIVSAFSKNYLLDVLTNFKLMICVKCMGKKHRLFVSTKTWTSQIGKFKK